MYLLDPASVGKKYLMVILILFDYEAEKLITEENLSLPEEGRRLNVTPSTINNWVKTQKAGRLTDIGKSQIPLTELEMERLRYHKLMAESVFR